MLRMKLERSAFAGIVLFGIVAGVAVAYEMARVVQLREGRHHLQNYAGRTLQTGERVAGNMGDAIKTFSASKVPFCSDEDIAALRNYVYNAPDIGDVGRYKNGKLYCTSGVGRAGMPIAIPKGDLKINGVEVFRRRPLLISPKSFGFIVESGGVSVVINPDAYKTLNEPPMFYSGMLYDRSGGKLYPEFGHTVPLTAAQVTAGKFLLVNGVFYMPVCSRWAPLCVVAAEPYGALMARSKTLFVDFLVVGVLLGAALGLIVVQLLRGQRSMEKQLRRAVRTGSLTTVYQPIVNLKTGTIVGAETLVRWINEDGESVRPDVFVALAEERGFAGEITRLVAKRVMSELGDLLAQGRLRVTINIASQDLSDPEFNGYLQGCLAEAGVQPSSIGIELTERSTANRKTAAAALATLKSAGHMVYIDDFGTGYSSLAYLHQLHVDAIKVDRAFTQTVGTEAVTASVVPQILAMAEQLDLLVVVEGIETEEQAQYFRAAGRGILGQGWLYGKPVPAAQFRRLVQA
jgi:sensor c-di-GMP phosphodiesterase-like protein